MIQSLLKKWLRQNQHFGRLAKMFLDRCRENVLDCCNANTLNIKDGTISAKGWESSHYQALTRFFLPIYSHFDSILNEDQLHSNSYKSFKQLSVLWHCIISRIVSEEDSSCEEIDIHVKLFLSTCNADHKTTQKMKRKKRVWTKKSKKMLSFYQNKPLQCTYAWKCKVAWKCQIWEGVNESCDHPVNNQNTVMKKLILICQHYLSSSFNHNFLWTWMAWWESAW